MEHSHNIAYQAKRYVDLSKEVILETLWPTRCAICDVPGSLICEHCRKNLPYIDSYLACPVCGAPYGVIQCCECNTESMKALKRKRPAFDECLSVVELSDASAQLVRTWKDAGEERISIVLAEMMNHIIPRRWLNDKPYLVSIPASSEAMRRRGFDHIDELCYYLNEASGIPRRNIFKRPHASDQRKLSKTERIANMENAIQLIGHNWIPSSVIVVDDVYTTGATMNAAAEALKHAGAQRVYALTFARA